MTSEKWLHWNYMQLFQRSRWTWEGGPLIMNRDKSNQGARGQIENIFWHSWSNLIVLPGTAHCVMWGRYSWVWASSLWSNNFLKLSRTDYGTNHAVIWRNRLWMAPLSSLNLASSAHLSLRMKQDLRCLSLWHARQLYFQHALDWW